jgi:hypothetical protein
MGWTSVGDTFSLTGQGAGKVIKRTDQHARLARFLICCNPIYRQALKAIYGGPISLTGLSRE